MKLFGNIEFHMYSSLIVMNINCLTVCVFDSALRERCRWSLLSSGETSSKEGKPWLLSQHRCFHPGRMGHPRERPQIRGDHWLWRIWRYIINLTNFNSIITCQYLLLCNVSCQSHDDFAAVVKGEWKNLTVAVKTLKDSSKAAQQFLAEASVMT